MSRKKPDGENFAVAGGRREKVRVGDDRRAADRRRRERRLGDRRNEDRRLGDRRRVGRVRVISSLSSFLSVEEMESLQALFRRPVE